MTLRARLLFLDFDGVLLTADDQRSSGAGGRLSRERVAVLGRVLAATEARVVVSSSWRSTLAMARFYLRAAGLRGANWRVIGVTPRLDPGWSNLDTTRVERGLEIQDWLDTHDIEALGLCILDDDDDMAHLGRYLVRIDMRRGLTEADIPRAVAMLMAPLGQEGR